MAKDQLYLSFACKLDLTKSEQAYLLFFTKAALEELKINRRENEYMAHLHRIVKKGYRQINRA